MLKIAVLAVVAFVVGAVLARFALAAAPESLGAETAGALDLEPVGTHTARAWYKTLPAGRADDRAPWRQLLWFKRADRTARASQFAAIDFVTGRVQELPVMVPSMEPWAMLWLDGKLYIGMNLGPRLVRYDPQTDELTDFGLAFENSATLFRMAVAPDGMLALGGGTGTDLATFDPKTSEFRRYGAIGGPDGSYVYSLSIDDGHIYCAVRGRGPWELVAVHRQTGERTVLATAPVTTHMSVSGNVANVPVADGTPPIRYHLHAGGIRELAEGERPEAIELPGGGFTGNAPTLYIDESPVVAGEERLRLIVESPEGERREATLAVGLDAGDGLGSVVATADGRIAALGRAYYPMVVIDPKTGDSRRIPMTMTSSYSLLAVGNRIFATGYPSTNLVVFDPDKPLTWTAALPDRPGVDSRAEPANPRLVHYFSADTGGAHIGVSMLGPLADGRVYLGARRHRYYYGFALAHVDPDTLETGVFDDQGAFNHLQIGWLAPLDDGRRLAISTIVEHNRHLPGEPPETASLFIVDVENKRIESRHQPVPGAKALLGVVQVEADALVGVALDAGGGSSTLYRFNWRAGRTEQTRTYQGAIGGGVGTLGVPVRANDFVIGPDKRIWTGVQHGNGTMLFRITPADLAVEPFGTLSGSFIRLLFLDGRLYVSGAPQVRRVKGYTY